MPRIEVHIVAPQMRDRVRCFRDSFVKNYLKPQAPYPVVVCLSEAGIRPKTQTQLELLQAINSSSPDAPAGWLSTKGGVLAGSCEGLNIAAEFDLIIEGKTGLVTVYLPDRIGISATASETELQLKAIEKPFGVRFSGGLQVGGYPLPDDLLSLKEVDITPDAVYYRLSREARVLQNIDIVVYLQAQRREESERVGVVDAALTFLTVLTRDRGGCGGSTQVGIERKRICAGSIIDSGWVKINTYNDPKSCGNPTDVKIQNVWEIEKYADRPVGTRIWVCADVPDEQIPAGWAVISYGNDLTGCNKPVDTVTRNIKEIERQS